MTVEIPESVTAQGNIRAAFVPAIANPAVGPTTTEMQAGILLSLFLDPDWAGFTGTQSKGERRRYGSRQTYQRLGRTAHEAAALVYSFVPQKLGTPGAPGNKVYETLAEETKGYLVLGYGLDAELDEPFEANEIVDYALVECGEQFKQGGGGNDEFADLMVQQELVVIGRKYKDRKIAA